MVVVVVVYVELWTSVTAVRQGYYILFPEKMQAQYVAKKKEIGQKQVCGTKVERLLRNQQSIRL
ncbi:MAG: hypothetical protein ACI4M1_00975 [Christensenellales bacterium]